MREGELITGLNDPRKFNEQKNNLPFTPARGIGGVNNNGIPLGYATNIETNQFLPQDQKSDIEGYTNPITGNNRIFTREEVGSMSKEEYSKHEKEIMAQTKVFNGTMPSNADLQREAVTGGGVVYVNAYKRADGTEVKGYYRSR